MNTSAPALPATQDPPGRALHWERLARWDLLPLNSEKFESMTARTRIVLLGMLATCDEAGNCDPNLTTLAGQLFPWAPPFILNEVFELENAGFIDAGLKVLKVRNINLYRRAVRLERICDHATNSHD